MIHNLRNSRFASRFVLAFVALFITGTTALSQTKIMPLGNSITRGVDGPSTDDAGYRNDLSALLIAEGQPFNFVGSLSDGTGFDADHEGHDGSRADQILSNIATYLGVGPDVVILHIGTNDVSNDQTAESTRDEIADILDAIDANSSSTKIILSSITPRTDAKDDATTALNLLIEDIFYTKRDQEGLNLFYAGVNEIMKQNSNWATDYFDTSDDVHPNDVGFNILAEVYFNVLMTALNSTSTEITDNFQRTNLGITWDADAEFAIQSGDLANTATTGTSNWQHMATFLGVQNPSSVAVKWAADADAAGLDEGGLALLLDSSSKDASGYLAWISPSDNELHLWTIASGISGTDLLSTNPVSQASTTPGPGKVLRVDLTVDSSNLKFDYYVEDEFAGSITINNPGVGSELYSGMLLRHNRSNDVDEFTVRKTSDTTAPDPITDLAAASPAATSIPLTWTATGDDGAIGVASVYDLRYSESPINAGNFDSATAVANMPKPSSSGTTDSVTIISLLPGLQYYFALIVTDEAGNKSELSNVVTSTTKSGNVYVDNFERSSGLGTDWTADPAYVIVNNQLSNTSTDGNWDDIAVLNARKNATEVSFKFADDSNTAGLDQAGFVIVFGSPDATASGYAITRRTAANEIRLWQLDGGALTSVIDKNQSPLQSVPAPGDIVKVQIKSAGGTNQFDFFINDQFDGSVEDAGQLFDLSEDDWAGVTLRSNLNNDIDNFSVLLEVGAPASLAKVSGDVQIDTVKQALPFPVVVKVTDENDSPIKGVNVDFLVTEGNGTVDVLSPTGDIVVEAEAGILTSPMVVGQGGSASQGEYIHVPEGTGDSQKGLAEYFVNVETAGEYEMWGRAIYPNANADAFRVIVDGVSNLWDIGQRIHQSDWHWDAVSGRGSGKAKTPEFDPLILTLSSGTNSIKIEHSKDGAKLDQFVITPVGSGFQPPANQDPLAPSGRFTDENGEALANWTLGVLPGNNALTVSASGLPNIIFTATGLPDSVATIAKISGDGQNGVPGQVLGEAFVVELRDKWSNLAVNAPLSFAVKPPGNGSLTVTTTNAGLDGRAGTLLTTATNSPTNEVSVTATGYVGAEVVFTASAAAGDPENIALAGGDGQTASAGQPLSEPLKVIVTDASGIPVEDVDVEFSVTQGDGSIEGNSTKTVKTDATGVAQITATLGNAAGAENRFQATAAGLTGSPVLFIANAAAPSELLVLSDATPTGLTNLPLSDSVAVRVLDELGAPVVGHTVGFAVTTGDGQVNGSSVANVLTNAQGAARVEWRMGPDTGQQKLLTSSGYQGAALTNSPFEFKAGVSPGPGENLLTVSGDAQTGLVGQPLAEPFVIRVTDNDNNPVSNWPVSFLVTQGGGNLSIESTFSDNNGNAQTSLTLGDEVGLQNNQVRASAPKTNNILFVASAAATSAATIELAGGGNQAPSPAGLPLPEKIQVFVSDLASQPVSGLGVTFRIKAGGGTLDGTAVVDTSKMIVTNSAGLAEIEWYLGGVLGNDAQALEVIAKNGFAHLDGSPMTVLATAIAGLVDADASNVEVDKDTVKGNGQDSAIVTVTLRDKFENPVSDVDVNIFSDGNDIIEQPQASTNANGEATGTISSSEPGQRTISARVVGGIELNSTASVEFEDVTSVELASLQAEFAGFDGVKIQWVTSREIANSGFNILRSHSKAGTFTKINDKLIAPNGDKDYVFVDREVGAARNYYYMLEDVDLNGIRTQHGPIMVSVNAPETFELSQNYPNPFNPETRIRFQLPATGQVEIRIYDLLGKLVRRLVNETKPPGFHVALWDARDDAGQRVSSGVFYYQIISGNFRQTRRMLLLK